MPDADAGSESGSASKWKVGSGSASKWKVGSGSVSNWKEASESGLRINVMRIRNTGFKYCPRLSWECSSSDIEQQWKVVTSDISTFNKGTQAWDLFRLLSFSAVFGKVPCKLLPYAYNFGINVNSFWKSSYFKVFHLRWENKVKKAHLNKLSLL